jgi:hypothetical protein
MKMTITEHALAQRIRRKLAHEGETISHGTNPWCGGGRCWLQVNAMTNTVHGTLDDLEAYGRELGVLRPREAVARSA